MADLDLPDAPEPLPHPVADNHCHLDMGRGGPVLDVSDALARAAAVHVTRIVQIGCDLERAGNAVELARTHVGAIAIGDQKQGTVRKLSHTEVGNLLASVGM